MIKKISIPKIDNLTDRLILANHSLIQLNITSNNSSKLSSVFNLTNNTLTPMGKRQFSNILLNPITNIEELNSIYELTNYLKDDEVTFNLIRENLKNIKDLDKIHKLIIMKKLSPKSLYSLFNSLEIISLLYKNIISKDYLKNNYTDSVDSFCSEINNDIEKYFIIKNKINIFN